MHGHREIIDDVKKIIADYPSALESLEELEKLLTMLESFGFRDYLVNLGIARGLDYYTGCVFEIYVEGLGAQKQISGGGTYNLIEVFGGEKVESTGFAFGFDRVMEVLKIQKTKPPIKSRLEVFVAPISPETKLNAFEIAQQIRKKGIRTDVELVGRKLKKILSFADNSGARFVVLVGARDLKNGEITLKDMRSGNQEQIPIETIADVLIQRINSLK